MNWLKWKKSPTKIIAGGYLLIILMGALLLMLPISNRDGSVTPFLDALFTATSATCVTGLVIYDTATHWSTFGHVILLCLIQIGGLGFMTMATIIATISRRRIGLKSRFVMQESIAAPHMGGIVRLTKFVVFVTIGVETFGAIMLSIRFIPIFGFFKGIWYGIFHSISAFCNAGFDLMGGYSGEFSSLIAFESDWLVNIVIMALIIFGGLGFYVWEDLWLHRRDKKHFSLQSKIVLMATFVLIVVPSILLLVFQSGVMESGLPRSVQGLCALFQSVTTRTAGFNSVSLDTLQPNSQLLMIMLMLVGGSPGSTAGGMKTTTFVVLLLCITAAIKREDEIECFGRRIDKTALKNAVTITVSYIMICLFAAMAICQIDGVTMMQSMFETSSAIATVGLTLGITPTLSDVSHVILMFMMFFGRIGCMTMIYALVENQNHGLSKKPLEKIAVG